MILLDLRPGAPKEARMKALKGLMRLYLVKWAITLVLVPLAAHGQVSAPRGTTHYYGGGAFDGIPGALSATAVGSDLEIPVALETAPIVEEDFFASFDSFMDVDKNLNNLQLTYLRALIPYTTYSTFYMQSRDTHIVRAYSLQDELVLRESMAKNLRNYLLVKGIPKFLATREETKAFGERYASIVGQTEKLTKLNMKNAANTTEFSAGLNPFLLKTWIRYRNDDWYFEVSKYLKNKNTSLASVKKTFREFTLGTYYHIDTKIIEPFYFEELSKDFNYQVGVLYYVAAADPLANLRNYIRFTYSF